MLTVQPLDDDLLPVDTSAAFYHFTLDPSEEFIIEPQLVLLVDKEVQANRHVSSDRSLFRALRTAINVLARDKPLHGLDSQN